MSRKSVILGGLLGALAACNDSSLSGTANKAAAKAPEPSTATVPIGRTTSPLPAGTTASGCTAENAKIAACDPKTGVITGVGAGTTKVTITTPAGPKVVTVTVPPAAAATAGGSGAGNDTGGTGTATTGGTGVPGATAGAASAAATTTGATVGSTTGVGGTGAPENPAIVTDDAAFACNKGQPGLVGKVYKLPEGTASLPNYDAMTPVGQVNALDLNVPARAWEDGFPALPGLIEWFGIKFFAQLDAPLDGAYRFQTISDDGSKVYVDDKLVLDNDGTHGPTAKESEPVPMTKGLHRLTVEWFQGPRVQIALQLGWMRPGDASYSFVPSAVLKHGSDCALSALGRFP